MPIKTVLPEPEHIYSKDFHFLDEPLINRQLKQEAKTNSISKKSDEEIEESKDDKADKDNSEASTSEGTTSAATALKSETTNQAVKPKTNALKTNKTSTGKSGVTGSSSEVPEGIKHN